MKIAVFTDSYQPYVSGVVRSIDTFGAELLEMGHEVYIFGPRYYHQKSPASPAPSRQPALKVFRFWSVPVPTYRGFTVPVPISMHAETLLAKLGIEIIHAHTPFVMGVLALALARRRRLPLAFTHHTMYHEYVHYAPGLRPLLRPLMIRYVAGYCKRADLIIAPTAQIREFIRETYGLRDKPVKAIPTGIPVEEYRTGNKNWLRQRLGIPEGDRILVFVGRLGQEKNVAFLLDALGYIRREMPAVHLVLVGDGPDRTRLERLARREDVVGHVHFTGTFQRDEVIQAYHGADLFVIASLTETQGLATLEAMAAGLPVVGVDAPGTRDMVHHAVEGLLTPNDPAAFAGAVVSILKEPDRLKRYSSRAVARAETLSSRRMARELVGAFQELLTPGLHGTKAGRDRPVAVELPKGISQ
ncbi:MAG: glycosyltransferase [Firmicutes bacterium]|nr:glycosyltransferase [Bacillota bacterium]